MACPWSWEERRACRDAQLRDEIVLLGELMAVAADADEHLCDLQIDQALQRVPRTA
jgi:hypothetical protein